MDSGVARSGSRASDCKSNGMMEIEVPPGFHSKVEDGGILDWGENTQRFNWGVSN